MEKAMTGTSKPRVGDERWEIEWCVKAWIDPEDGVTGDPDRDVMSSRMFPDEKSAQQFAVDIFLKDQRGAVSITPMRFTMEDADLYPRGHWEYSGDTYYFEGEFGDDGSALFNR